MVKLPSFSDRKLYDIHVLSFTTWLQTITYPCLSQKTYFKVEPAHTILVLLAFVSSKVSDEPVQLYSLTNTQYGLS